MNNEELDELIDYNLEYLEARNSEVIFGGDYTSAVDLKYANKEIEQLQRENQQLKDNWNKLKEELNDLRARTFIKYNSNEWNNCLSFNDDILPIINKMQELEKGDSND